MRILFILLSPLLLVIVASPVGATVCGALAVGRIRRSGGVMKGLDLAVADMLLFPLLLLNGLIVLTCQTWLPFLTSKAFDRPRLDGLTSDLFITAVMVAGVVLYTVLDLLIVRWVWRAETGHLKRSAEARSSSEPDASGQSTVFLWVMLAIVILLPAAVGGMFTPPWQRQPQPAAPVLPVIVPPQEEPTPAETLYTTTTVFELVAPRENGQRMMGGPPMFLRIAGPLAVAQALQSDDVGLATNLPRDPVSGELTEKGQAWLDRMIGETIENLKLEVNVSSDLVDVVTIRFSHADPRVAERLPLALFNLYKERALNDLRERLGGAMSGLRKELADERARLKDAQTKKTRFEIEHKDVAPNNPELTQNLLKRLKDEMKNVEDALAEEDSEALRATWAELNERVVNTVAVYNKIRQDYLALHAEEKKHAENVDRLDKQLTAVEADFKAELARHRTAIRLVQPPTPADAENVE